MNTNSKILCYNSIHGPLAQLGERHAGSVEVTGSSPVGSTNFYDIIPPTGH